MVNTDWREILSFSQKDLKKTDKDKLCESLSWMDVDDIDLSFADLKTLFRLAQDILKFKSEQVNNLMGQLETTQRKNKKKSKTSQMDSPKSKDSVLETIVHQEEMIKANKEILEQLQNDIEELERKKGRLEDEHSIADKDSESSRDALSEMEAIAQLENEVASKNRHIKKLLSDVKTLEEENTDLKGKVSVLKDKLTEATQIIENFTEQLFAINKENNKLKEILGSSEQAKVQLSNEIEALRKELFEKEHNRENLYEDIKAKVQHWKDIARSKKAEVEALLHENKTLKEDLTKISIESVSPKKKQTNIEQLKIKELQEKLCEASNEIIMSANIIKSLKSENLQLKRALEDVPDTSMSEVRNESDEGKERIIINKLKRKNKSLTDALKSAEEAVKAREKELAELTAQLQLLRSDDGIAQLLEGLKNKKRQLQLKDEGIKTLVKEVNELSQSIDDLQIENETMRQKLNIPSQEKIPIKGFLKKYRDMEHFNENLVKQLRKLENKLVDTQLENRNLKGKIVKLNKALCEVGYTSEKIDEIVQSCNDDVPREEELMPQDGGGESSYLVKKRNITNTKEMEMEKQMQELAEENEGLRKGFQEILDFLKDNSSTSSGILALECPSLEAMLQAMEARHAAGWFAPHMSTIMALKTALGSKDALLAALHDARKETFDVMTQLSKESQKSSKLEQTLQEKETKDNKSKDFDGDIQTEISIGEYGSWIAEDEQIAIDFTNEDQIKSIIQRGDKLYEDRLRNGLVYFHNKLKILFDKMTSLAIQANDDKRRWSVQEENYKQEIEKLKAQIVTDDNDDTSDVSPGIISTPSLQFLQRKCSYLEESYKYIRTLNENIKNECLEIKKDAMIAAADYESHIQKLVLSVASITDRLRGSISLKLFWNQNAALHEMIIKHRKLIENRLQEGNDKKNLFQKLENYKLDILSRFQNQFINGEVKKDENSFKTIMTNIEQSINSKQLENVCSELESKCNEVELLQNKISELQENQSKLIDDSLTSLTITEIDLLKDQLERLSVENKILKEQCQHIENQLDVALVQLQDSQQRRLNNDMEINMLRHQILDLQSVGDNKAIVARLSGEVLVAHLQASESHKKIERLSSALNKEKELRAQAEEMLSARQKIFEVYISRHESKFNYMLKAMEVLRREYQGSLPLVSLENYLNKIEDLFRKNVELDEKLNEIENLRCNLMSKHTVFDQILDVTKNKCLEEHDGCPHKLKNIVMQKGHSREIEHCNKKIKSLETSYKELLKHCNYLERTLVQVNQGLSKSNISDVIEQRNSIEDDLNLKLEDILSDDESRIDSDSGKTVTLSKPNILKDPKNNADMTNQQVKETPKPETSNVPQQMRSEVTSVFVQTTPVRKKVVNKELQTDESAETVKLSHEIASLKSELTKKSKEVTEAKRMLYERTQEVLTLSKEKLQFETSLQSLKDSNDHKDDVIKNLRGTIDRLKVKIEDLKRNRDAEREELAEAMGDSKKSLLNAFKQLEDDKNAIVNDYKELLIKERQEFAQATKDLQNKISELKEELERKGSTDTVSSVDARKEVIRKYTLKVAELENKCFSIQSELDDCNAQLATYQSEVDRWKSLASERLSKMEHLNSQLEERHNYEVETYKAENDHWLSQLNETQKEHMELRTRLSEQKACYMKQLADKDGIIDQLRSVNNQLKTQIMNMQTMISVNDPSFDLSAIVEVDETSDGLSQSGSGRLELKFDSVMDLGETQDDVVRFSSSSTIWQEPLIERLRREKQLSNKQNALLRRQIKALAARERRARLDAQNLKNQVFRISTTGNKVATVETAALQNRIATLQAQLMSARRDNASSVALWDKWKRAQQAAERWQARFEEKCQEVTKLQSTLNLAKSSVARLEKEKRVLLTRINELRSDKISIKEEKQDFEAAEKGLSPRDYTYNDGHHSRDHHRDLHVDHDHQCQDQGTSPPVSSRALLDRVEAQQRRIVALEAAEKGNEYLVSEYEKALAEVTSMKGQVLKLESTLLESQIKCPSKSPKDSEPELDYWKRYCEMLKEENVQLNLKLNAMDAIPSTSGSSQNRIHDLEQTILTLRGVVNKLQAEQKGAIRKPDSRPGSGRSFTEKSPSFNKESRSQIESYRTEIANLKRSIHDKDLLLERSKEMLKIAAEREDELLRENALLRHELMELRKSREGFLSA